MRIRKVFELNSEEEYYQEVPFVQWPSNWHFKESSEDDCKPLTVKEEKILIDKFPKLKNYPKAGKHVNKKDSHQSVFTYDIYYQFSIRKTNDEWYYIKIIYTDNPGVATSHNWDQYFKCDQFDGLVKCIENEIIKK